MRAKIERTFQYPVDDVCRLLMESGERYSMQELPNVTSWKVLEEQDDGVVRRCRNEWSAHGQIPRTLQHILTPKMLSFIEHSEWDRRARVNTFRIEPHYLKAQAECFGTISYKPKDEKRSLRIFEVTFHFNVPVLGPVFEQAVMSYLKKNEETDARLCEEILKKHLG